MAVLSALVSTASLAIFYMCLSVQGLEDVPDGEKLRAVGLVRLSILLVAMVPLNIGLDCWTESMISRVRLRARIERKLAEDIMLS